MNELKVTNDFVFKKLFGNQENQELLKDLLESIIEEPITNLEIQKDATLDKTLEINKVGVLDVKAVLRNNIVVNIEMQVKNQYNTIERSLFYWAGLYHNGLNKGEKYISNKRTISINILNYKCFEEGTYHEVAKIRRKYKNILLTEDLELHYIQIPKFIEENRQTETKLDQWIQFIGNISKKGVKDAIMKNKVIKEAKKELDYLTGDEETRRLAELRDKAIRDENTNIYGAIEEGKKMNAIEIAKEMVKQNISIDVIISVTKLTKEELEKYKVVEKAKKELDYLTGDEETRRLAELRDKAIRDENTNIYGAIEEGKKINAIEIAKKMIQKGIKIDIIKEITELSEEEINKLK